MVAIPAGSILQTYVDANPNNTHFELAAGNYPAQTTLPKLGNWFVGPVGGDGWGTAIFDGGNIAAHCFRSDWGRDNVRIENLQIRNYRPGGLSWPRYRRAAIQARNTSHYSSGSGFNWQVINTVIDSCTMGIAVVDGALIQRNQIKNCDVYGLNGAGPSIITEYNEIDNCGLPEEFSGDGIISPDGDAGTMKYVFTTDSIFRHNWIHHNKLNGIWYDINNDTADIHHNLVTDNGFCGIFWELNQQNPVGTLIHDNAIFRNGQLSNSIFWLSNAGILIAMSSKASVYGNTLDGNGHGIIVYYWNHPGGLAYTTKNNHVWGNEIRQIVSGVVGASAPNGLPVIAGGVDFVGGADSPYATASNNRWRVNTGYAPNIYHYDSGAFGAGPFYWSSGRLSFAGWNGVSVPGPQDVGSTVTSLGTALTQPSWNKTTGLGGGGGGTPYTISRTYGMPITATTSRRRGYHRSANIGINIARTVQKHVRLLRTRPFSLPVSTQVTSGGNPPGTVTTPYRVNVGGEEYSPWNADAPAMNAYNTSASAPFISNYVGTVDMTHPSVPQDWPQALFHTERYAAAQGGLSFDFPMLVPSATYRVKIGVSENWTGWPWQGPPWYYTGITGPGQRVFSVFINGTPVATDLDLWATVGLHKAYVISADVAPVGGRIIITTSSSANSALINAIEINALTYSYTTPTYRVCVRQGKRGRGRKVCYDAGYTVIISGGVAAKYVDPSLAELAAADPGSGEGGKAIFLGGRGPYEITAIERDILLAAGLFT